VIIRSFRPDNTQKRHLSGKVCPDKFSLIISKNASYQVKFVLTKSSFFHIFLFYILEAVLKISGRQKTGYFAGCQSLILPYSNGHYLFCHTDFFPEKSGRNIFKTASYIRQESISCKGSLCQAQKKQKNHG